MNHEDFKIDKQNDPRIFANTIKINDDKSEFNKSIFTLCKLKEMKNVHLGLFKHQNAS